jgi:hypothetical protein
MDKYLMREQFLQYFDLRNFGLIKTTLQKNYKPKS